MVLGSDEAVSAIAAEARANGAFDATVRTRWFGVDSLAAIGTEARATGDLSATGAGNRRSRRRLLASYCRAEADAACQIDLTAVGLLTQLVDGAFAFERGDFLIHFGRAGHALVANTIPTNGATHPLAAARALIELRRDFGDGLTHSGIVRGATDHALNIVGRVRGASENSAEQATSGLQSSASHTNHVGLEGRHVAVSTTLAAEFKLETFVGRKVLDVIGERNVRSHSSKLCSAMQRQPRRRSKYEHRLRKK